MMRMLAARWISKMFSRPVIVRAGVGFAAIMAAAYSAGAQSIRGTVSDSGTRQGIPGVVVTLVDRGGAPLRRTVTDERGSFQLAPMDGIESIRLQRIGFRAKTVAASTLPGSAERFDFFMMALPSMLEAVHVVASANCPKRPDRAAAFALLDQARAGLLATVVARESNPGKLVQIGFERTMDGTSDRITHQRVRIDSANQTTTSFKAVRGGADFVRLGFTAIKDGQTVYFAPDADVLLDDGFAGGYCFRIAADAGARANQIGLGFAAADRKAGRIDIDGTLWIDTVARALSDIEFRYVGLPRRADAARPGGQASFRSMANGVVLIDRWSIRLPKPGADTTHDMTGRAVIHEWVTANESGGELARGAWPGGTAWQASLGTLRVQALVHGRVPAAGMVVRLDDTDYRGVADSSGDIEIRDLVPGPYTMLDVEPNLAQFGIAPPILTFVAERGQTVGRTLSVKTIEDYIFERCTGPRPPADSSVFVIGRIETPDGRPVEHAEINFSFVEGQPFTSYTTGSDGMFQLCRGRRDRYQRLTIEARVGKRAWTTAKRTLADRVTFVHFRLDPPPK